MIYLCLFDGTLGRSSDCLENFKWNAGENCISKNWRKSELKNRLNVIHLKESEAECKLNLMEWVERKWVNRRGRRNLLTGMRWNNYGLRLRKITKVVILRNWLGFKFLLSSVTSMAFNHTLSPKCKQVHQYKQQFDMYEFVFCILNQNFWFMAGRKKRKLSQIEGNPAEEQGPDPADLHYFSTWIILIIWKKF